MNKKTEVVQTQGSQNTKWIGTIHSIIQQEREQKMAGWKFLKARDIVGGFLIETDRIDVHAQQQIVEIQQEIKVEEIFAEQLVSKNIAPIAIIPTTLWKSVCQKFGLYQFENIDAEGRTNAQLFYSTRINELIKIICLVANCIAIYVAMYLLMDHFIFQSNIVKPGIGYPVIGYLMPFVWLFGCLLIGMPLAMEIGCDDYVHLSARLPNTLFLRTFVTVMMWVFFFPFLIPVGIKALYVHLSTSHIEKLFPEKNDYEGTTKDFRVNVQLNQPSQEYLQAILYAQACEYHICTAAEKKAIKIFNLGQSIRDYQIEQIRQAQIRHDEDPDPISYIYNKDKTSVAILAQHGNFRKEKAAIEYVKNLLLKN